MHELDGLTNDSIRSLFAPELRTIAVPLQDLEWRESGSGDGSRILSGYAAVFNQRTTLYSGKYFQLDEQIDAAAFDDVLSRNPDVHLNIGHDMTRAMARTGIKGVGGLELSVDAHGLRVYARLSSSDPDVQALAAKMDLGVMDQMSFAFRMGATTEVCETDEDGRETELLTINTIAELYDVCVCAQGAYSTTEAALRTLAMAGAHDREVRAAGAQDDPAVTEEALGAQDDPAVTRSRLLLEAEMVSAALRFRPRKES
jgi:HK97 family phage prohead protease